jgi:N-methylhydantoinase B
LCREPQRVLEDVIDGKISPDSARDDYGVVLDPEARSIDFAATERRRAALADARGAIDWTFDRGELGRS